MSVLAMSLIAEQRRGSTVDHVSSDVRGKKISV